MKKYLYVIPAVVLLIFAALFMTDGFARIAASRQQTNVIQSLLKSGVIDVFASKNDDGSYSLKNEEIALDTSAAYHADEKCLVLVFRDEAGYQLSEVYTIGAADIDDLSAYGTVVFSASSYVQRNWPPKANVPIYREEVMKVYVYDISHGVFFAHETFYADQENPDLEPNEYTHSIDRRIIDEYIETLCLSTP